MFKREFITKQERQRIWLVARYMLPISFLIGLYTILMGNNDSFFILVHAIMGVILLLLYTKRKGTQRSKERLRDKYKWVKVVRIVAEVVLVLIIVFQIFDTVRYSVAMTQIQFKNEGYVTVTGIKMGTFGDTQVHANEYSKKDGKIYQHTFDGWKYKSRVDITDRITEEMKRETQRINKGEGE